MTQFFFYFQFFFFDYSPFSKLISQRLSGFNLIKTNEEFSASNQINLLTLVFLIETYIMDQINGEKKF